MQIEEHFYTDDPAIGPPDVRTRLPDTDYFFLGNGQVQAAVQVCRSGQGTPVGLLVMHPSRLGPKRAALTCHPEHGLAPTAISIRLDESVFTPDLATMQATWDSIEGIPAVRITWEAGAATVVERIFCPDRTERCLARRIEVKLEEGNAAEAVLSCDLASPHTQLLNPSADGWAAALLIYEVSDSGCDGDAGPTVTARWSEVSSSPAGLGGATARAAEYWGSLTKCRTRHLVLDHLFSAARSQLPSAVDGTGRMDGSIWQYNLEWVRDQAHVVQALVRLGDHTLARTMLVRLLDEFVSPEGDTVDSGRRRQPDDVELDQNGELLTALATYVDWTGDLELVKSRWAKVRALAAFPLGDQFCHDASGLVHNRREYWERHSMHGIEDGFELMSQFFVTLGLESAASLADALGHDEECEGWTAVATRLRHSLLEDPAYRLIENDRLIKRRGVDGAWQGEICMESGYGLPLSMPLLREGRHLLDPDASAALPVAYGFVDANSPLAANTLAHIEELWNQEWEGGGYGRYHASSEADSPGAWPFASLFVARAYAEMGDDQKVWRILHWLAETPGGRAGAWFENDGPRVAPPYPQMGFPPWTWAEMITLFVHHLLGVRPDRHGLTIRPRLLLGLDEMKGSVTVGGHRLHLSVRRAESAGERGATAGPLRLPWETDGVRMDSPSSDLDVEVLC